MFRVDFSEPVVGLGPDAFTASTGDVTGLVEVAAGGGASYLVTVGGPDVEHFDGNVTLSVNHSAVFDAAGNQMTSTGYRGQGYATLDNTGTDGHVDLGRQVDAGNDTGMFDYDGVTNSDQLVWTVNTSEPIALGTLTGADFALTGITPDVDTYHHGGHGHRGWIWLQ